MWCARLTQEEFRELPLSVRMHCAMSDLVGWRYGTGADVRFPKARPMLPKHLVSQKQKLIDCSSGTAYVLATAIPHGYWDEDRYRELQIMEATKPWSPVDAVEKAGVGSRIDKPIPGMWALSQAWVDDTTVDGDGLSGGHARLVKFLTEDLMFVFESTTREGRIGPRTTTSSHKDLVKRYPAGVRYVALGEG